MSLEMLEVDDLHILMGSFQIQKTKVAFKTWEFTIVEQNTVRLLSMRNGFSYKFVLLSLRNGFSYRLTGDRIVVRH